MWLLDQWAERHICDAQNKGEFENLPGSGEPLITLAKTDSVANRRLAFARTRDNEIVAKLFNELGPRFASRAGGYTRILKCGFRAGDNAPMAYIELVDRSEKAEAAAE